METSQRVCLLPLCERTWGFHEALDWVSLLARLTEAKTRLVDTISARSDAELYGGPWYGKWTKGRMIQFKTSSPYANARVRIRKWLKEKG